jgi:leucine dehydrogenase
MKPAIFISPLRAIHAGQGDSIMVQGSSDDTLVEQLQVIDDPARGALGVIAIHSTALGPAAGGCRFWHYASNADAATDAMRLARGMSYKNAMAGLPFGGGKAVLQKPAGEFDRKALFEAFADVVESMGGTYVTAEDVGTSVEDMHVVAHRTRHVAGLTRRPGFAGAILRHGPRWASSSRCRRRRVSRWAVIWTG